MRSQESGPKNVEGHWGPISYTNGAPASLLGRPADHSGGGMPNCKSFVTENFLSIRLRRKRGKVLSGLMHYFFFAIPRSAVELLTFLPHVLFKDRSANSSERKAKKTTPFEHCILTFLVCMNFDQKHLPKIVIFAYLASMNFIC